MRSPEDVRIISLNIQHGWNVSHSMPVYVPQKKIFENLDRITKLIQDYDADVILLQEVDQISPLTRRIDQLSYIQSEIGHQYSAYGASSELRRRDKLMYSAGCGIISRYPMTNVENIKFELSFPTPRKGFLCATLSISPGVELTVVSVHLVSFDILKSRSREAQIDRMAEILGQKKAVVIGGDLNISMRSKHMNTLMSKLNVTTHHMGPNDKHLRTFPAIKPQRRIDWILTSPHLGITDYRTFPNRVSDHLAVGTTISL
ncbi:MAG: endonuclease/exonuclease/phosphatase family protein [bacterium]|nr:endonuclease/exonuclease/phosphatase family protein [bacterium]